jgi:hypothetical protein
VAALPLIEPLIVFVTVRLVELSVVNAPVDGVILPTGVLFSALIVTETPEIDPPVMLTLLDAKLLNVASPLLVIVVNAPVDGVVEPIGDESIVLPTIVSELIGGEKNSPPGPTKPTQTPVSLKMPCTGTILIVCVSAAEVIF